MIKQYCKDCRWWEDSAEIMGKSLMIDVSLSEGPRREVRLGTCHRTHHFEAHNEEDWCGEFESKYTG